MQPIRVIEADLSRPDHQHATLEMIDAYSRDPRGDGKPLAEPVRGSLIDGLREHPTTMVFLAFDGEFPVGIAVCFRGFSTFAARPLINIHDLHVLSPYQSRGIGRALLAEVEAKARHLGYCKLLLEVHEDNQRARRTYASAGFEQGQLEPADGFYYSLTKVL